MSLHRLFDDENVIKGQAQLSTDSSNWVMNLGTYENCSQCSKSEKKNVINFKEKTQIENNLSGRVYDTSRLRPADSNKIHQKGNNPNPANYTPAWLCERLLQSDKFVGQSNNNFLESYKNTEPTNINQIGKNSSEMCTVKKYLEENMDLYADLGNNFSPV